MTDMIKLKPYEITKLANLWEFHRQDCKDQNGALIAYASGGGIGTRVLVTCGCGTELDVTDYSSW
jgi:hypothetical protein